MAEHVNTKSLSNDYNIAIRVDNWLSGEEAYKNGFIFLETPLKFDIFGFLLNAAGFNRSSFVGIRTPSQFAQIHMSSRTKLPSPANWLTNASHVDTPECIELGIINDNPSMDDYKREVEIAKILAAHSIGVRFYDSL